MSTHTTDEKEEEREKRDEKDEKERGEKLRNDPLSAMAWAAVLIWAGIIFLADNLLPERLPGKDAWPLIAMGAGGIFLLEALVRTQRPEYRRPIGGTVVFALILISVGFGELLGWGIIGPLALILIGGGLLVSVFLRRQ